MAGVTPTEPYDFLGLMMQCNVYAADIGKWASFSVMPGQVKPAVHLPWFSSMQQKETMSGFGEVTINLTPPTYEEALQLLGSHWLTIGNTMAVRWGYTRHASHLGPLKYYMMLKPDVSFGDEFTVSLRGTSFGWLTTQLQNQDALIWNHTFADSQGGKKRKNRATYRQVIELVAKRYGFTIDWNGDKKYDSKRFSQDARTILDSDKEQICQGGLNDWQFLKHLAARCCCRAVIVGGNVLRISDVREPKQADWTFRFRGQLDLANNVIPMDSFDSESTAMFLPVRAAVTRFLGPDDKRVKLHPTEKTDMATSKAKSYSGKDAPAAPSDQPAQRSQSGQNLPHDAKGSQNVPIPGREQFIGSKLKNLFDYNAEAHGAKAKISSIGVPSLLPDDLVRAEGVGDYFTGMYRVFEINWSLGESVAKQDVDLMPRGFPSASIANWMSQRASSPYVEKAAKKALQKRAAVSTDANFNWTRELYGPGGWFRD